jgi:hypothetical protein
VAKIQNAAFSNILLHFSTGPAEKSSQDMATVLFLPQTDLSLEQVLKVVVGAGGGIAPVLGPPDGQQEQVHSVCQQPVVISN